MLIEEVDVFKNREILRCERDWRLDNWERLALAA